MSEVRENYGIDVRRCKYFATLFLADTPLATYVRSNYEGTSEGEKIKVDRINHAFEVTVREIAYEHVCFSTTDTIKIEGGRVHFYVLSEQLLEAFSLKQNGKDVAYKIKNNYLYAPDGEYEFTYAYMPRLEGGLVYLPYSPRLTERIVALGTCANYCMMSGQYNEANAFDSAYKDALNSMKKSFVKRKVRKRRWL